MMTTCRCGGCGRTPRTRRSSFVRKSSLVGLGEVLGYVAAVMAMHVVDLGGVDHGERLCHELLEAGTGHGLVVHEAQLEVALGAKLHSNLQ